MEINVKIRIKFKKYGTMKFIGHLDVMRYFQKVMRRSDVDIVYTSGYSPHQVMSFAAPLGVGLTSDGEYLDIEVNSSKSSAIMVENINKTMVEGIEVVNFKQLPDDAKNAMSIVAAADYLVSFRYPETIRDIDLKKEIDSFFSQPEIIILKKAKKSEKEADIKPMIYDIDLTEDNKIFMKLATGSTENLKPDLVVESLFNHLHRQLGQFDLLIHRLEVYAKRDENIADSFIPLEALGTDIIEN